MTRWTPKWPLAVIALASFTATACAEEVAPVENTAAPAAQSEVGSTENGSKPEKAPVYSYKVINTYPHDTSAFTQGLLWKDGHLYEGTGRHGQSTIRQVDLETGEALKQYDLPREYFGEGIVDWQGQLIGLTWRSGKAFVLDAEKFSLEGEHSYDGEGWGLTRNEDQLIMSDGSDTLRFLNPETFDVTRRLNVTVNGQPLPRLNELEWIDGEIFANIWQTNAIVAIDPKTGAVTKVINLNGLSDLAGIDTSRDFVLNGIAWDAEGERLFVTGKYWPKLFEIELVPTQ